MSPSLQTVLEEISSSIVPFNSIFDRFLFCFSTSSPLIISALIHQQKQQRQKNGNSSRVIEIQNFAVLILVEAVEMVPTVAAFVLSLCARAKNISHHQVGFCDLSVGSNSSSTTTVTTNNNNTLSLLQQILLSVDPIYSPTLVVKNEIPSSLVQESSCIIIELPEDILFSDSTLNFESFFLPPGKTNKNNISWNEFSSTSSINSSHHRSNNKIQNINNDELISRFCEEFHKRNDVDTSKKNSVNNNSSSRQQVQEKKWGIWLAQKIIANNSGDVNSSVAVNIKEGSRKLESLFPSKSNHQHPSQNYFEKLLRDCTNSIMERRGINNNMNANTSPIRNIVAYFSPNNKKGDDSQNNQTKGENNNHNNDEIVDDETEAILRALTEKKKSMTLAKRAEEWFAELSARGVPAPLKQLAMAIPYHWRFWLTPMGFLVIGTSFMMLFGVVLLFM